MQRYKLASVLFGMGNIEKLFSILIWKNVKIARENIRLETARRFQNLGGFALKG